MYFLYNTRFSDNGFAWGEPIGKVNIGGCKICTECKSYLTLHEWLPPYNIKISSPRLGDIIFGSFGHFVISEAFRNRVLDEGINGLSQFEKVSLYQKNKLLDVSYYYPKVEFCMNHVDLLKSGIEFNRDGYCSECQLAGRQIIKMDSLVFTSPPRSPFSDLFSPVFFPGEIIASERAKKKLEGFLNVEFLEQTQFTPGWLKKPE